MKVLLIGGGTGGHILPLEPLARELVKKGVKVTFLLADQPLDRAIAEQNLTRYDVRYLSTGKIRRYWSWQNFVDGIKIIRSIWNARKLLKELQPDVLFFKGGFVGFPILVACRYLMRFRGKIYTHESDISGGVMTRWAGKKADKVFESFGRENVYPLFFVREASHTSAKKDGKKSLLIFGGSQGAKSLNELVAEVSPQLIENFDITLITGRGKQVHAPNITQYESLPAAKLAGKLHAADLVISRGGANSLFEIMHAQKPALIIPLASVARNHQEKNARYFSDKNLCHMLVEKDLNAKSFLAALEQLDKDAPALQAELQKYHLQSAAEKIAEEITGAKS